jgi:ubiquinone/menaquinone biosynthesis C-methylase UbiE
MDRPFYTKFAWAFDLIIHGSVTSRVDFIVEQLGRRGVLPGTRLLDAGCGTGTYSVALAQRGFSVTGIDSSADLIAEARGKAKNAGVDVQFVVGNILEMPEGLMADAVLCRGVLNDLTEEESRRRVFPSFAGCLRKGGVLILDVREWHSTVARKRESPVSEKSIDTERGRLTFRSVTELLPEKQSLLISETHTLESPNGRELAPYNFVMRCWTQQELAQGLESAGFGSTEYFGDYDAAKAVGSTDRLVAVSTL